METDCKRIDGKNCSVYPLCSCMGLNRTMYFNNNPLCNDCPSIEECGSLGCVREKNDMTDRCENCTTTDTCNVAGCIAPGFEPCGDCSELFNCHILGCLSEELVDEFHGKCILDEGCEVEGKVEDCERCNPMCCGDPADCNEPCSIGYSGQTDDYLPGVDEQLDGRNESPVNRHGCSYVDCGCTVPCTSDPTKIINITINGDNYGDIKI